MNKHSYPEVDEKRKARLDGKKSYDTQQRKTETPEKRASRLQEKRTNYAGRQRIGLVPPSDDAVEKFHSELSSLETSKCNTCHESLPSLTAFNHIVDDAANATAAVSLCGWRHIPCLAHTYNKQCANEWKMRIRRLEYPLIMQRMLQQQFHYVDGGIYPAWLIRTTLLYRLL